KAKLARVRFAVVPDTTTRALELRKGSADLEINALTPDMESALQREPRLALMRGPGTRLAYMAFNLRDPILKDVRVRHALAIALDIRSFEFATFFSDITHGEFQLYSLRWIGGNEDPDIFEYAFSSARIIPNGANRQYYSNPRVDALIAKASTELDQNARKQDYAEIQQILAEDLPYINLWYFDNVMVYSKRVHGLEMNPSGNYDFLRTAELAK